jgi:pimeloyl-ACP methyl ester carboxylesterase
MRHFKRKDKMKINWNSLFALCLTATSGMALAENIESNDSLILENCHIKGIKQQLQCGQLLVPENYSKVDGEKISVNVVVLPAIDSSNKNIPLMFLAGGPGQAAAELSAHIYTSFNEIRKTRDIILIDQRGTGESHPLQCEESLEINQYTSTPEDFSVEDIQQCIEQLSGDLTQYNSENGIRDFEAVRAALGHEKINIYGGSYGTRAGLVYMRMFPKSINAVILDSVGPIEVPIGLFGQSAARSFNLLLENCKNERSCQNAYPNLADEFKEVTEQLMQSPITVEIDHPTLGTKTDFVIDSDKFISTLQMQLYSMQTRALTPLIIHQAYLGNYKPLAGLISQSEGGMGIYMAMHFNIVCNEDLPKISPAMKMADSENNFAKDMSLRIVEKVCAQWPQYRPSQNFYQTVTADIPTLIMSGHLDPVTPPSNGEKTLVNLPNSHHITSQNNAHIVASTPCGIDIVSEFLEKLTPNNLDESCLKDIPKTLFMSGLNGGVLPAEIKD